MLLSRLQRENDVVDEVTIHHLSITDGNTSQKNLKKMQHRYPCEINMVKTWLTMF